MGIGTLLEKREICFEPFAILDEICTEIYTNQDNVVKTIDQCL